MKEITNASKLVVVKHNRIIDAEYNMTVFEQRILLTCIAKIDSSKSMDENRIFTISVDDIVDMVGIGAAKGGSAYANLKSACESLFSNIVTVEHDKGTKKIHWMSAVDYIESQGKVELRFTPEMMPFLTEIKNNFTKYNLSDILKFKSAYSIRLYEWLCHWGGNEYTVEVSWLREKFKLTEKYARMADFRKDVLDIATKEITERTRFTVTYDVVMQNRRVVAIQFLYSSEYGKKTSAKIDKKCGVPVEPTCDKASIDTDKTKTIDINIAQLNAKEKVIAQNALAKVPEDTQQTILNLLKEAIAKGNVKSPIRYLNGLVSKALSGDLNVPESTIDVPITNDFTQKSLREEKIRKIFAKNSDKMKADLDANGYVIIQGEGTVSKSEFEALGLIEKAPHTISSGKSLSLTEMMEKALEQENKSKVAKKTAKRAKPAQDVKDIPVGVMSEKEIAARQKILELEAQLIAEGKFEGVNKNAIADDEIAKLAEMESTLKSFKKMAKKSKSR
jgi:plasmid replication initiation protein